MGDLRNVFNCLEGITGTSNTAENVLERNGSCESEKPFKHGETVAGVWHEDVGDLFEWHLGVVDKIDESGIYIWSYMKRSDKNGFNWWFPDEADIEFKVSIKL